MNNNNGRKVKRTLKKSVKNFITRVMLTIILFLVGMILVKEDVKVKNIIIKNVYEAHFDFTKYKALYQKYFGKILSVDKIAISEKEVFKEEISYSKMNKYKDGVKLTVSDNYLVPALESGIVVFIGEKEDYGNTIIIEQINGIDVWYSNITNKDIKMYDYIEKGTLLGEAEGNSIYMVFQKDGKNLDYKEYL